MARILGQITPVVHGATFFGSGDASTTLFTVSHGLNAVPTAISVEAASPRARGDFDVSGNASSIFVTYNSPPLSGDVTLTWLAGPSNLAVLASGAWQTSGTIITITSGSSMAGIISGNPTFGGTPTISGTMNAGVNMKLGNAPSDAIYTIFRVPNSNAVNALNNVNGTIDYSGDATVDCSTVIQSAINNIKNISGVDTTYGAKVDIKMGRYKCTSGIQISRSSGQAEREGIMLEGQGKGTVLSFENNSGFRITDGIKITSEEVTISNMRLIAQSGVTHLIGTYGTGGGSRSDYGCLENLLFESVGIQATYPGVNISGQVGFYMEGDTPATFFWTIHDCHFRSMKIGMHLHDLYATSTHQTNNTFYFCDIGEKISAGQHNISNIWCQGESGMGRYGFQFLGEGTEGGLGGTCNLTNIHAELLVSGAAAIQIESGAANLRMTNITNGYANGSTIFVVKDNNEQSNFWDGEVYLPLPARSRAKRGWWSPGSMPVHGAGGILNACLFLSGTITTSTSVNGPLALLTTSSTSGNVASVIYKHSGAGGNPSNWRRSNNPRLYVKMYADWGNSNQKAFIGLWNGTDNPTAANDMLSGRAGIGVSWNDASGDNWWLVHNASGTGAPTRTDTGLALTANIAHVAIKGDDTNGRFNVAISNEGGGIVYESVVTSNIPTNEPLGWLLSAQTTTAGVRYWDIYDLQWDVGT